jgi:hypothetical protein
MRPPNARLHGNGVIDFTRKADDLMLILWNSSRPAIWQSHFFVARTSKENFCCSHGIRHIIGGISGRVPVHYGERTSCAAPLHAAQPHCRTMSQRVPIRSSSSCPKSWTCLYVCNSDSILGSCYRRYGVTVPPSRAHQQVLHAVKQPVTYSLFSFKSWCLSSGEPQCSFDVQRRHGLSIWAG